MTIIFGKLNVLMLLLSYSLVGGLLYGGHQFFLRPAQTERDAIEAEFQAKNREQTVLAEKRTQLRQLENAADNIEFEPEFIPMGDLQPESLLFILAEAAAQTGIKIQDHRFGVETPVQSAIEEEDPEAQGPSLIRNNLSLSLEGDNEAQFQEFIFLIEQSTRLIQVETFSLDQTLSRTAAAIQTPGIQRLSTTSGLSPLRLVGDVLGGGDQIGKDGEIILKDEPDSVDLNESEEGSEANEAEENNHQTGNEGEQQQASDEVEDETDAEEAEAVEDVPAPRNMRASVTLVVYFFES